MIYAAAGRSTPSFPMKWRRQTANVVVVYQGNASAPFQVAVAPVKPGIFTDDSSGSGQGAILNQDYSRNGPANPAQRGQYVFIYGPAKE
jgi:trimeric autotransporter adhesin